MVQRTAEALAALYEIDETAWLEATAELVRAGRLAEVDAATLSEYLADLACRDRREVESQLIVLLVHIMKWPYQPDRRTGSWRATVIEQRQELESLVARGVLRAHAEAILAEAYRKAVERVIAEIGLPRGTFPEDCPTLSISSSPPTFSPGTANPLSGRDARSQPHDHPARSFSSPPAAASRAWSLKYHAGRGGYQRQVGPEKVPRPITASSSPATVTPRTDLPDLVGG